MNASRSFRLVLMISAASALLLPLSLRAVSHNPANQSGENKLTTDVSISSATATVDEDGEVTVVVSVDGGTYPDLLASTDPHASVKVYKEGDGVEIASGEVTGAGDVTISFSALKCDCKIDVKIIGLTSPSGGGAETSPMGITITPSKSGGTGGAELGGGGAEDSGGGSGGGGQNQTFNGNSIAGVIQVYSPLGAGIKSDGGGFGGGAGSLRLDGVRPSPELYSPSSLTLSGSAAMSEQVYANGVGPIRQVVAQNQITDIVTQANGYTMNVYDLAAKGIKGADGVYFIDTDNLTPIRSIMVENPGPTPITAAADSELYVEGRYEKKLTYALPLTDNNYNVQLYFNEPYYNAVGLATFDVVAGGETVLSAYDVFQQAGGKNIGKVEQFATTVNDGVLNLAFNAQKEVAHVSAIKVTSAGGTIASATTDASLYTSSRLGEFTWQTDLANGSYNLTLYFAEPIYTEATKRVFNIWVNGDEALPNYDIFSSASGTGIARMETIPVSVTDGHMTLQFVKVTGDPRLCALTVSDAGTGDVVIATNAGGPAYTSAESVSFVADTGFSGGVADAPGRVVLAIKAGDAYTATDGTAFVSDQSYVDNQQVNGYLVDGTLTRLKVTKTEVGRVPEESEFSWSTDPKTGAFGDISLGNSLRQVSRKVTWAADGQSYDETSLVTDGSGNPAEKTIVTYERFSFGLAKVKEQKVINIATGAALVTSWGYYDRDNPSDPKPDGYGLVKSRKDPTGYWEIYTYNSAGALLNTTSQYLDSVFGDTVNCKVEAITRSTANPVETHVTTINGQEVARSYRVDIDHTDTTQEFERSSIICLTPGAAWDASDNLVTTTCTYTSNNADPAKRGKTKWIRRPDGTMTIYAYAQTATSQTVTADTGAPNSVGTYIVSGKQVVTIKNTAGQVIDEATKDLQNTGGSPGTAVTQTLLHWFSVDDDLLGRPTIIGYDDGTTKTIAYVGSSAACGTCSGPGNFLVESEIDRNGVVTDYIYDALNRRTDTIRLGVTEQLVYDAAGRVLERHRIGTDSSDIRLEKTIYDLAGRVTSRTDALGNVTDYAYDYPTGGGMVTTITNPAATIGAERGTRIETTYADGQMKGVSGTAVSPVKYAYGTWSASGKAGQWTQQIKVGESDSETEWAKTYTDLARRTVQMVYADTAEATMAYNILGQLKSQTDPDGVTTLYAYNAKGEREITAIDLDQDGNIDYEGTVTPLFTGDRITKTVRDVVSHSGTIVNRTTTRVWADSTDTATTVSTTEQDGYGNDSWQTDIDGNETHTVIERAGGGAWTVTTTAPDLSQQVQTYTGGRLVSTTRQNSSDEQITKTDYAFDAHNRVETQTDARTGNTVYTYTDRDEVHTVTTNNGTETTSYVYDALGNQLTITRPTTTVDSVVIPHVTTNEYYLRNYQLKKVSGSLTYPVEYTYDPQGRMKTLTTWQNATTSAGAAVTTWNYDTQRGWLTQKLYDDNHGPSYTYTDAGRLLTRTWVRTVSGAPLVTTYGYDNAGQLNSTGYSDATPDVAITYNRFGAQKTVTDATGERTFTYNTTTLRPEQEQLSSYYDDRIITRSYQTTGSGQVPGRYDGFELGLAGDPVPDPEYSVVYGYDTAGRLGSVTDLDGSYAYTYTANSNLRHTLTSPVHVATTTYESNRDVIDILENKVGSTSISKYDYTVNSLGQRTARANTGTAFGTTSTDAFSYNDKGEVTGTTNATISAYDRTFAYDDIGNRTSATDNVGTTTYTANTLNAYTAIGAASPTHDADGNQTTTGTGQIYHWDGENRLLSVEPVLPVTSDLKQINTYDGQSRRVRKEVYTYTGSAWSLISDEKFIYDGWNVVAVLNAASSNALLRTYTWGLDLSGSMQGAGGVGGLLSAKDGSSVYHYTYDANGNVSEVLNNSGGIAAHYEYDAFGNTVASSGTYASTNAYRFSTKPLDSVSELYYYGFRYYNPSTGRWLSRDPIEEQGGVNLYLILGNNVLNHVDKLGLQGIPTVPGETYSEGPPLLGRNDPGNAGNGFARAPGEIARNTLPVLERMAVESLWSQAIAQCGTQSLVPGCKCCQAAIWPDKFGQWNANGGYSGVVSKVRCSAKDPNAPTEEPEFKHVGELRKNIPW